MNLKISYKLLLASVLLVSSLFFISFKKQQKEEPWTQEQLLDPSDLAKTLNNQKPTNHTSIALVRVQLSKVQLILVRHRIKKI